MSNNIKGYLEDLISEYRSQAAQLEESVRAANQKYKERFRSVISHQKGEQLTDAYGKTTFPLTFGRLEKIEMFMGAFADLEATAEQLFIRKMSRTEEEYMRTGLTLYVPTDCLSQLMAEHVIIDQANTVDVMADELTGGK